MLITASCILKALKCNKQVKRRAEENLRKRGRKYITIYIYLGEQSSALGGIMKDIPVCQRERQQVDGWEGR